MNESDYEDAVVNFNEGLYAFGYSLTGKQDDASGLTHETFYRLLTKGAMVRDSSKIKSWLFTTLGRVFLGWEQRRIDNTAEDHRVTTNMMTTISNRAEKNSSTTRQPRAVL